MSLSDIIISGGNCHVGHNEPNCPRVWSIEGGPGWIGQRMEHPVEMICSPSCGLINKQRNNNDNEGEDCSLILALHGLYSNPSEQKWLMIGTADDPNGETFLENEEEENGPFCISFHKSVDYGWDWKCGGDDEAHLEAFIHYALDNFSIDPDAINLHGYSSGGIQINTMMNTGCSIESLISAVAVYGAGNVENPPTTKASYLIAHGTHDNIVPYEFMWDHSSNTSYPSCECTVVFDTCTNLPYIQLQGERLGGAIASLRGYTGDIWNSDVSPVAQIDLNYCCKRRCDNNIKDCNSVLVEPNPFNEDYSCEDPSFNTDVIEFPVEDGGPVVIWRMNLYDHYYPNKRLYQETGIGPTNFFLQMRTFFNSNRGRYIYSGTRQITQVSTGHICTSPMWYDRQYINKVVNSDDLTKDECMNKCLNEMRCLDAFYLDLRNDTSSSTLIHKEGVNFETQVCVMYYDVLPCLSTTYYGLTHEIVQWRGETT